MSRTFTLEEDEYATLLLCMGYASGAAQERGMNQLASSFMRLANAVNRDNPNFRPYKVPPDENPRTDNPETAG